ncbi:MAG TPA: hypothetical protein VD930_11445 [Gemmatimonadales bacterium]|nr:hypothetical protein [Gemmatimonadales bacterium]
MKYARLGLAIAGFIAALLSIALDDRQVGWGAIALLTASLILRLLSRSPRGEDEEDRGM